MTAVQQAKPTRQWIVSSAFDLLFVANLWWVALLLLPYSKETILAQSSGIEFWQIYFITAPHRWITLLLVATDPDRREGRGWVFAVIAMVTAVIVVGLRLTQSQFACLVLIDFLWNAWHFGSQHGGILRIYGRMGGGGHPALERWAFRTYVIYVSIRAAAWATGWTEQYPAAQRGLEWLDWGILLAPASLVILELIDRPWQRLGKLVYLISAVSMYAVLLYAIRSTDRFLVITMAVAYAAFHAVEYFAIVTFYAQRRSKSGSPAGAFRLMARNWLRVLAVYLIVSGMVLQYLDREWREWYIGLNLWAAFLHYAYDGMIWKLRRVDTAKALAVDLPKGSSAASAPAVSS
ncbi:MAG: hypothetical protein KDB23_07100 [Planctomycetales bacterium]|nr:hypothetical protein [Planctomycetales bacterium]